MITRAGLAIIAAASLLTAQQTATKKVRLNNTIAKLEKGEAVIHPKDWMFIDMEHGPYLIDRLQATLDDLDKKRDANGNLSITPIVRIPQDGDEDFRWTVKQVLDSGAQGIIFPHIESREQALRAVQAMRYPAQRGNPHPEPAGKRGWAPQRAVRLWHLNQDEYLQRADVWPLNPDGELLALVMIETVEGAKHIREIVDVPGVGGVLLGPSDLGVSLGVGPASPLPKPAAEDVIQTVLKACLDRHVYCAYPVLGGEAELKKRLTDGFKILMDFRPQ
jgi:4-hydroxy-2-oxoheptanedioate aldolase